MARRPSSRLHVSLALALALASGCQAAPGLAPPTATMALAAAPAADIDAATARLAGVNVQDWTSGRFAGDAIKRLRDATPGRAAAPGLGFDLQAIGGASGFWPAAGVALAAIDPLLSGHHAVNGPAWAYRSTVPALADRIWFLTSNGLTSYLVGVKANQAPADGNAITIPLGHLVSKGYVCVSDDGRRLYALADDGTLIMARPERPAGSRLTTAWVGGAAVGISPFIDPWTTDSQSGVRDYVYAARNDGTIQRYLWNGTTLAASGTARNVCAGMARALDGSATRKLAASPVVINDVAYVGDRGGNLRILHYNAGTVATHPLYAAQPVETSVALDLDDSLAVRGVFLAAGSRLAWWRVAGNQLTLSRPLLIDKGTTPEGLLTSFSYTAHPTANFVNKDPDDSCTVLVPNAPPGAADLLLPNSNPPSGPDRRVRYDQVGGAHRIRAIDATCSATYFDGRDSWSSADGTEARSGRPGDASNGTTMGSVIGPQGELILAGDGESNDGNLRIVPAVNMTAYGRTMQAYKMYRITNDTNRDARSVAYWDHGTPGDLADDYLYWVERNTGRVARMRRSDGAIQNLLEDGGGAAGPPASIGAGNIPRRYNMGGADKNCGLAVTPNGDVFVGVRNDPDDYILRLRPSTPGSHNGQWRMDRLYADTGDDIYVDDLAYDPFSNTINLACVFSHTIQRFTPPAGNTPGPLTIYAGVLNTAGDAPNGTDRLAAGLNQPSTLTFDPATGDLYIGEYGGKRVKVIYGPGHDTNPHQIFKIAGNGSDGDIDNCDGPMDSNSAIGAIGTMRMGPPDLAAPNVSPNTFLYFYTRTAFYLGRLQYAVTALPATTKGLLRWTGWPTTGSVVAARLVSRISEAVTAVPRPELYVAGRTYANRPAAWTSAGLVTATNHPPAHDTDMPAFAREGGPADQVNWALNSQLTYDLPSDAIANASAGGTLALALVPPQNGLTYHYDGGLAPPSMASNDRQAPTIYPHNYGSSATTRARRPKLSAIFSPYTQPNPISAPPTLFVDGAIKYAYVMHNNAIYRLDFTDAGSFADGTRYATSRIGRRGGIVGTLDQRPTPDAFLHNLTTPLLTWGGSLIALDYRPTAGSWDFSLNRFDGLAPTTMYREAHAMDGIAVLPPLGSPMSTYVTYDGFGADAGSAFFGLANGRIYRLRF